MHIGQLLLWLLNLVQNISFWEKWWGIPISPTPVSPIPISPALKFYLIPVSPTLGMRQANLVLISYASSEGSGEPAHPRSLTRTFAARSYKQWVKRNLQTESQIPGPSEWLGMRSWNLSWRHAGRHKFAWRGSLVFCAIHSLLFMELW